jgi:hypothetical protein
MNDEEFAVRICGCFNHGISGVDSKAHFANVKFRTLDLKSVHRNVGELRDFKELV